MKTVLITGASRGIGRAAAELFAAHGCRVILNYCHAREETLELERCLRRSGADTMAIQADVREEAQVRAMVETAQQRFGFIDTLVNNAGISRQELFTEVQPKDWNEMFAVHVNGAYHACRAVLPSMLREHCGSIVNVSSVWGVVGASCEVPYSAAKAALIGMTRALAKEVGPSGIRVNAVAPGVIDTAMNGHLDEAAMAALEDETPLCRVGTPQEAARAIVFLASDEASFITGQTLGVDGGFGLS